MKIVVIGASRGIGLEVVKQALERGHEVTALLRDPGKLALEHARLHKVRGDVGKPEDVRSALSGQDAVCTCVGVNPTAGRSSCFLAARAMCSPRFRMRRRRNTSL